MGKATKLSLGQIIVTTVVGVFAVVVVMGLFGGAGVFVIAGGIYLFFRWTRPTPAPQVKARTPRPRTPRPTPDPSPKGLVVSRGRPLVENVEPVPVPVQSSWATPSFRVPEAPKHYATTKWIPVGESVTVANVLIPGGMIYVGTSLETPSGQNDPCLIDPSRSLAAQGDYTVRQMGYWPSYSEVSSSARRAYLNWLAVGRKDPAADIGYVFLFFYGLERRAILDAAKDDAVKLEWPGIAAELRRLLAIYGDKSGSFRSYAGSLLDWVSLAEHPAKTYLKPVPSFPRTHELPLYLRVALGQAAVDAAPIPATLALAWARLEPTVSLRTPANRCPEEFEKLFLHRYHEAHGDGMVLPRNRTKLKLVHRPASAGFRGHGELTLTFANTPDVTALTAPVKKLQQLVEATTQELEAYSRYVLKNPGAKHAFEGLVVLPTAVWPEQARQALLTLKGQTSEEMVSVPFEDLLARLDARKDLTRDKVIALAQALASEGVGMEPDVLAGAKAPKPDDAVVLFAISPEEAEGRSTPAYQAAALTLQLASAVAAADGAFGLEEMDHLKAQVRSWTHLTSAHIHRLTAQVQLLREAPVGLTALRKKLEPLSAAGRETIARFMATVAQSDGEVAVAEVKLLERVYKALGVDPAKVFADLHAASTGADSAPRAGATVPTGFTLDPERIAALQRETEAVSTLLADIFAEDEPVPSPAETGPPEVEEVPEAGLLGLDEPHSALARLLLSRPGWSMEELADVASDLDLMLGGALETLNEAALEEYDMPFLEGEDPVMVNAELVEKIAA